MARAIAIGLLYRYLDVWTQQPVPDPNEAAATIAMARPGQGGMATANSALSIYPVPAQKLLTVSWQPAGNESDAVLHIADLTGRTLLKVALRHGYQNIDISGLPSGIYLGTVKSADGRLISQQKLVKE